MTDKIIYLVGFMGAGKSAVGHQLAILLERPFIDLDEEIERRRGHPIREIFRLEGEAVFRAIESRELEHVSRQAGTVVALGGGTFCGDANRRFIETHGLSVWLDAPLEVLLSRCDRDGTRPLLAGRTEIEGLFERRRPLYAMADIRIDAARNSTEQLAAEIAAVLANMNRS